MEFLKQSDEILGVGEFSRRFKMLVKTRIPELWLKGEISNLKTYSSGHTYFTLKDDEGAISAVLFKGYSRGMSLRLEDGMRIFAFGEISIYEARGSYQIVVKAVIPDGAGSLAARFQALKEKLSAEGLFDAARKKPVPLSSRAAIAVVHDRPVGGCDTRFLQDTLAQGLEGRGGRHSLARAGRGGCGGAFGGAETRLRIPLRRRFGLRPRRSHARRGQPRGSLAVQRGGSRARRRRVPRCQRFPPWATK